MNVLKYSDIALDLDTRIRQKEFSTRIPSVRTLVKEYGVSRQTIGNAVRPLLRKGILRNGKWNGLVIQPEDQVRGLIGILGDFTPPVHYSIGIGAVLPSLFRQIREDGYNYIPMDLTQNNYSDKHLKLLDHFDGIICYHNLCHYNVAEYLRGKKIPFVLPIRMPSHLPYDYTTWNHEPHEVRLLLKLREAGCCRISKWHPAAWEGHNHYLRRLWKQLKKRLGFPIVPADDILYDWNFPQQNTSDFYPDSLKIYLDFHVKTRKWPDAMIFWHSFSPEMSRLLCGYLPRIPSGTRLLILLDHPQEELEKRCIVMKKNVPWEKQMLTLWRMLRARLLIPELGPSKKKLDYELEFAMENETSNSPNKKRKQL